MGWAKISSRSLGRAEEQCSEVRRLAENGARGVDAVDLSGKGEPGETTMEAVLSAPCCALVMEGEAVPTPGVTDEVMHGTEPVKRTAEPTVQKRMKALAGGGGRGDLERPIGAYRKDELLVAL